MSLNYKPIEPVMNAPLRIQGIFPFGICFYTLEFSYNILVLYQAHRMDIPHMRT